MPLIQVTDLEKHFTITKRRHGVAGALKALIAPERETVRALDGVSFSVDPGEILGYIGPNGAGKSTTIKVLTGILTPTAGEALVDGCRPYENRQENAKKIGFVFGQRSRLWWLLPAYDSLEYTRSVYSIPDDVFKRNMQYCKETLGLGRLLDKPVRVLSLGERMRVEIAMAMLHSPKILYLDEPTVGLDVVGKCELRDMIKNINRQYGITVILATHDVMDIEKLCSRVIIIDRGRLVWEGDLGALRKAKGNTRVIVVDFASEVEPLQMPGLVPASTEGQKHVYEIDADTVDVDTVLQALAQAGQVLDLSIAAPDIEGVIREIYTEGSLP